MGWVALTVTDTFLISPSLVTIHRPPVIVALRLILGTLPLLALLGVFVVACCQWVGEDAGAGEGDDGEEVGEKHVVLKCKTFVVSGSRNGFDQL
jgi:hypothetical protein